MTHAKMYLALIGTMVFVVACQPEPNRNNRRFGRNANGTQAQRPTNGAGAPIVNQGGDMQMTNVAAAFASPDLSSNPEWSLGTVSAQNGVKMWAEAYVVGGGDSGELDGKRSRIHIEINDSNAAQFGAYVMHIGYDNAGFEGAEGGITAGSVALRFDQSGYGSVLVTGQISGGTFSGQVSFVNNLTDNAQVTLGNFQMQTCAFFVCQ